MALWCIHGNLQRATVWERFAGQFTFKGSPVELKQVDLYAADAPSMSEWTASFLQKVQEAESDGPRVLMGYSLGGRLALQALLATPQLWDGAVLIAADPGLPEPEQRTMQLANDHRWGQRFSKESWECVLRDWDELSVFCGVPCPTPRSQSDFPQDAVVRVFDVFSKGRQPNFREALENAQLPPIFYVSGELDRKYTVIGNELQSLCPSLTHAVISGAGHRVPWEIPDAFVEVVNDFLSSLSA